MSYFFPHLICLDPFDRNPISVHISILSGQPTGRSIITIMNQCDFHYNSHYTYCKRKNVSNDINTYLIIIVDHEMLRRQNRTKHSSDQSSLLPFNETRGEKKNDAWVKEKMSSTNRRGIHAFILTNC